MRPIVLPPSDTGAGFNMLTKSWSRVDTLIFYISTKFPPLALITLIEFLKELAQAVFRPHHLRKDIQEFLKPCSTILHYLHTVFCSDPGLDFC